MRRLVTTAAMLVMVLAVSSDAFAQRDSGAKARGDNDGFWSPRYSHRSTGYTRQTVRRSIFSPSISRSRRLANVPPMLGQATVNSTPVAATASARTTISELECRLVQCVRARRIKFVEFGFEACLDVPKDRPEKKQPLASTN